MLICNRCHLQELLEKQRRLGPKEIDQVLRVDEAELCTSRDNEPAS